MVRTRDLVQGELRGIDNGPENARRNAVADVLHGRADLGRVGSETEQCVSDNSQLLEQRRNQRIDGRLGRRQQPYSMMIPPGAATLAAFSSIGPETASKTIRAPLPPVISMTRPTKSSSLVTTT